MSVLSLNKELFQKLVAEEKRTVLLDFWAPWCGPCRRVVPIVEEIAALGWLENTVFISFSYDNMVELRRLLPDAKLMFLTTHAPNQELVDMLLPYRLDLDIAWTVLTREGVELMHANGIEIYNGRYDYYLEHRREPLEVKAPKKTEASVENAQKYHRSKQERAHQVAVQKRIALLEKMIADGEAEIEELSTQMAQPDIAADYQKVDEICQKIEAIKSQNEAYSEEWLLLCDEIN